ncbi:MAG: response regulator [Deltaproteobacteria bacterium]|nr:response regulator [Deltaproteobacteria bacterium]
MVKILVVDDEIEACNALKEFLVVKGHEVYTAQDGKTALDNVQKLRPQLVLLDMIMPGMNGMEVLKGIKKIDPQIGVIMVTVVTNEAQAKKALELGAYDYITKPVDLNYLDTVVMVKVLDYLK